MKTGTTFRRIVPIALVLGACAAAYLAGRLDRHPAPQAAAQTPIPAGNGDINGDGNIDIADVVNLLLYLFVSGPPPAAIEAPGAQTLTAIVVRHCEKDTGTDPHLTPGGWDRANHLRDTLAREKIGAIFATKYNRTIDTVTPTSLDKNLPIQTYADADLAKMAAAMRALPAGTISLVAGNSFNLTAIVNNLGVTGTVTVNEEYDNLMVVRYGATDSVPGTMIHLRYWQP